MVVLEVVLTEVLVVVLEDVPALALRMLQSQNQVRLVVHVLTHD
jgi:hypothetical protein